jgi:putative oxidoreductase
MFKNLLLMKFFPSNVDAGLLALRLICVMSLFLRHGLEKLITFSAVRDSMLVHHGYVAAIGVTPSLICATLADGVCGFLLILGLATRWAALGSCVSLFVAWTLIKHMAFLGKGPDAASGELMVVYIGVAVTLVLAGGGRFSLDALIDRFATNEVLAQPLKARV